MTSHTHYIDVACIQSMRASANFRPDESPHSAHLCTFSLVWISYVFLERQLDQMTSYNWSMCWLWLQCGWACAFTEYNLEQITSGSGHKCMLYCIAVGYNLPLQISCSTEWLLTFWTNLHLLLLSIQAVSSLGLAWIGNTQLSTAPVCWTERSLSLNSTQTLKDFDLVALLNTTFC